MIVVCKKYYLDVVIKELNSTSTYKEVCSDHVSVISRHVDYMMMNKIVVQTQHEQLPSFYWLPKLHKTPYGARFIAASNNVQQNDFLRYLHHASKAYLNILNNIVKAYIDILV